MSRCGTLWGDFLQQAPHLGARHRLPRWWSKETSGEVEAMANPHFPKSGDVGVAGFVITNVSVGALITAGGFDTPDANIYFYFNPTVFPCYTMPAGFNTGDAITFDVQGVMAVNIQRLVVSGGGGGSGAVAKILRDSSGWPVLDSTGRVQWTSS
jgi:hypothetical protein